MSLLLKLFSETIYLVFSNKEFWSLAKAPVKKGFKVLIYSFLVFIPLTYFSCTSGSQYFESMFVLALWFGSFLMLFIGPVIIAVLYYTFFCDEEYLKIVRLAALDKVNLGQKKVVPKGGILKASFQTMTIILSVFVGLILSFFYPVFGFFVAGVFLFWDFSSYGFSELNMTYRERLDFVYKNYFYVVFLSVIFGVVFLIPFSIIFFYPVGVYLTGAFVRDVLTSSDSS